MGDWRDSVRSQRSEKTDAVRVCRKTGGRELCLERERDDTQIATKCYCLLTRARQWVTAMEQEFDRPQLADLRPSHKRRKSTLRGRWRRAAERIRLD
jgi:hypothetical protein